MGKTINFADIKPYKGPFKRSMKFDKTDDILLDLKGVRGVAVQLFLTVEEELRDWAYNPEMFDLVEASKDDFLKNIWGFLHEEEPLELVYGAEINGTKYRILASATMTDGMVDFDADFYKQAEGGEWLVYAYDEWARGPGFDFFTY